MFREKLPKWTKKPTDFIELQHEGFYKVSNFVLRNELAFLCKRKFVPIALWSTNKEGQKRIYTYENIAVYSTEIDDFIKIPDFIFYKSQKGLYIKVEEGSFEKLLLQEVRTLKDEIKSLKDEIWYDR